MAQISVRPENDMSLPVIAAIGSSSTLKPGTISSTASE